MFDQRQLQYTSSINIAVNHWEKVEGPGTFGATRTSCTFHYRLHERRVYDLYFFRLPDLTSSSSLSRQRSHCSGRSGRTCVDPHGFGSVHWCGSPPACMNRLRLAALTTNPLRCPTASLPQPNYLARKSAGSPADSSKACQTSAGTLWNPFRAAKLVEEDAGHIEDYACRNLGITRITSTSKITKKNFGKITPRRTNCNVSMPKFIHTQKSWGQNGTIKTTTPSTTQTLSLVAQINFPRAPMLQFYFSNHTMNITAMKCMLKQVHRVDQILLRICDHSFVACSRSQMLQTPSTIHQSSTKVKKRKYHLIVAWGSIK